MQNINDAECQTLTHLDSEGRATMVDVGDKECTEREASAQAWVRMKPDTLKLIQSNGHPKGDVFAVARVAGILAAKKTHELIPLCHALLLNAVNIDIKAVAPDSIRIVGTCRVRGQTGVELGALTAVSIAALTIYDMCKAVDRGMTIEGVGLLRKAGGRSGTFTVEQQR
ncbi:cyclic pyranopterin monophosphate synthase MoaC [Pseudomonas sp. NPDC090202]|uniref:cyclic pyranopterin monophosphate synthase MoaC n=1 Tax=unclassified Pseudomonas TaxID=196821 RepID=UPI00381ECBE1